MLKLGMYCPCCNKVHEVVVCMEDFLDWRFGGKLAQDAFPYLTKEKREQLITEYCPSCQKRIFTEF